MALAPVWRWSTLRAHVLTTAKQGQNGASLQCNAPGSLCQEPGADWLLGLIFNMAPRTQSAAPRTKCTSCKTLPPSGRSMKHNHLSRRRKRSCPNLSSLRLPAVVDRRRLALCRRYRKFCKPRYSCRRTRRVPGRAKRSTRGQCYSFPPATCLRKAGLAARFQSLSIARQLQHSMSGSCSIPGHLQSDTNRSTNYHMPGYLSPNPGKDWVLQRPHPGQQ